MGDLRGRAGCWALRSGLRPSLQAQQLGLNYKDTTFNLFLPLRVYFYECSNRDNRLVPASCCDWEYLESAFNHDEAFFLKTIGTVNPAEMEQKLLHNLKERQTDSAFLVTVEDLSGRWFQKTPTNLTLEQKTRLLPYLYRSYRTTVGQLARCLREDPQTIERIIRKR